jgi:mono/diheme cytochrome c family protein
MKSKMSSLIGTGALIALGAFTMGALAEDRVEQGRRTYSVYCASCHGLAGRGDGPVAGDLKVAPTDLTRLAARNDGRFPQDRTHRAIDGRLQTRGHGTSEMPVWGATFQVLGSDHNQEREVRERILDLLSYIESIQR